MSNLLQGNFPWLPPHRSAEEWAGRLTEQTIRACANAPSSSAYVYVIENSNHTTPRMEHHAPAMHPIKIGKAVNVVDRMKGLQTGSPYRHRLAALMWCHKDKKKRGPNDRLALRVESFLHSELSDYSMSGEWFAPEAWNPLGMLMADISAKGGEFSGVTLVLQKYPCAGWVPNLTESAYGDRVELSP